MGVTSIHWAHYSFNPWWGCVEVSPACDFCYARALAKRYGHDVWGKDAPRRFFGDKHWAEPYRWDRAAAAAGERRRVFCASMADVGEERQDEIGARLDHERKRLWEVVSTTPNLDWLLLTKRPRLYRALVPETILARPNVWPGVTVESPDYLWRVAELIQVNAAGPLWVSHEPALAYTDFSLVPFGWRWPSSGERVRAYVNALQPNYLMYDEGDVETWPIRWVVVGGESGPGARPFNVAWARSAVARCRAAGVPVFVKQLGANVTWDVDITVGNYQHTKFPDEVTKARDLERRPDGTYRVFLRDRKGGDMAEWPEDLRVREFPRG